MTALVCLVWSRDPKGYEIRKQFRSGLLDDESKPRPYLVVAPRSSQQEPYTVEGTEERIFLDLANTPRTPDGVVAFANKWGLLGRMRDQDLNDFYRRIANMAEAVDVVGTHSIAELEHLLKVDLRLSMRIARLAGDSAPRIILDARTLQGFCNAELMQLVDGGVEIRKCPPCGKLLALGKVGQQPSYCSDRCRVAMHRKKKREREARSVRGALKA
jgi:predicted nucleic acid-binding Zn ribbon protein